jgi:ribosomal protein L37E
MFLFCSYMRSYGIWARFQIAKLSNDEKAALRATLTLSHFRDGDRLVAVCSVCHFGKIKRPRSLRWRLAPHLRDATLPMLERRLTCSKCGSTGKSRFYYAEAEDPR